MAIIKKVSNSASNSTVPVVGTVSSGSSGTSSSGVIKSYTSSPGASGTSSSGATKPSSSASKNTTITNKNYNVTLPARPDMSRNQSLAGQSVWQGDYVVSYDNDGYATSAVNPQQLAKFNNDSSFSNLLYTGGAALSKLPGTDLTPVTPTPLPYKPADPMGIDNYYAQVVANGGKGMYDFDLSALASAGATWNDADAKQKDALAAGDTELAKYYQSVKDQAHADAEMIRAFYGYSGGEDGSEYNLFSQDLNASKNRENSGGGGGYDLSEYLRQMNAAQLESQLANLKYAYQTNLNEYDAKAAQLPKTYDAARNNVAAQNALEKKAFDERAAASGLSSGAAGQAALARSSAYQRDIANLDQAQANALSDIELQKAALKAEYENAIVQAKATGNASLANALYQELLRVQGLEREDAQIAQQLALEYGFGVTDVPGGTDFIENAGSNIGSTGTPSSPKGNPSPDTSTSKGYDNGSLTANQVKILQGYYGLVQDGLWGPTSQKTTGMSADEAWSKYLYQKYSNLEPDTSQRDNSAYWSTVNTGTGTTGNGTVSTQNSYEEVLADMKFLDESGVSERDISDAIAGAQAAGLITQQEAVRLQMMYGVGR